MYSTDLEETQWQVIKKILNVQERKRKYDLREIWIVHNLTTELFIFQHKINSVQYLSCYPCNSLVRFYTLTLD